MTITLAYLKERFRTFNEECFGGDLPVPTLRVGSARTMLGSLCYKKERRVLGNNRCTDFTLSISSFYDLPQEEIDDTLLHEMIHLYIASRNLKDDSSHGRLFRQKMDELNSRFGRHINVSHRGKLEKAEHGYSQNIIAVVRMQNGNIGVMRPSRTRILEIIRTINLYYKVESISWYFSTSSYFDTLPRSLKPRVYRVDSGKLKAALVEAIPLKIENNRITRL